jgi:hypothetical protein
MRIDIKPVNTRGKEITEHFEEYIQIEDEHLIYVGRYYCNEWEEDGDEGEVDKLVKIANKKENIYRDFYEKYKRQALLGVEKYYSEKDNSWTIELQGHCYISFNVATEKEAQKIFDALDKWIFQ